MFFRFLTNFLESKNWREGEMAFILSWCASILLHSDYVLVNSFAKIIGSKDIGQKNRTSDLLASLGMGTMFECFQVLGISPNFKEWLNIDVMEGSSSSAKVLSIQAVMRSGPGTE